MGFYLRTKQINNMMYYGKISKTKSKKEKYAKKKVWLEEAIQEGHLKGRKSVYSKQNKLIMMKKDL